MFKIYLAVAHKNLEDFLKSNKMLIEKKIEDEVDFVGTAVYREGIIQGIKDYHPDIIIVREGIPGSLSLSDLVYQIKIISPSTRIIFIAGDRKPGDAFLATLVQYGVYDILIGQKVNVKDMIKKIIYPNKLADVIELMPKIRVVENKQLYEAPDLGLLKPMLEDATETPDLKPLDDIKLQEELQSTQNNENEENIVIDKSEETIKIDNEPEQKEELTKEIIEENIEDTKQVESPKKEPKRVLFGRRNSINLNLQKPEESLVVPPVDELPPVIQVSLDKSENKESVLPPIEDVSQNEIPSMQNIAQPIKEVPPVQEFVSPIQEEIPINQEQPVIQSIPQVIPQDITQPVKQVTPTPIIPIVQQPVQPVTQQQPQQTYNQYVAPTSQNPFIQNNGNGVPQQNPYEQSLYGNPTDFMFTPRVNVAQENEQTKKSLFGKKTPSKTVAQQVVAFCGGRHGCGNSQMAFNTALLLAEQGYKTLYMDLDERFSSIESVLAFGFKDLGIDTMLRDIALGNYPNLINAISSAPKILTTVQKGDSTYKTYSKLTSKLEMTCFSLQRMYSNSERTYDVNLLKELNMFLLMNMNYDVIIMDAPSDYYNPLTQIALVYSNRIMFTITQDAADVDSFMRNIRVMQGINISYREKSNVICNKYISHTESNDTTIQNQVENISRIQNCTIITVPNVVVDAINASASETPLLWKSKDKNFKKGIQSIANFILS